MQWFVSDLIVWAFGTCGHRALASAILFGECDSPVFAIKADLWRRLRAMFTWKGVLDRPAYVWLSIAAISFVVGTILFFPLLLKAIVSASHCGMDTCGALALVGSAALRPLLFIIPVAIVMSACIRRARDAGLPPWLGAFPPLMLVGDQGFLQFAGAGWAYPFSAGILTVNRPVYALFATALIGLLSIPARNVLRSGENRVLDRTMLALAGWLSVAAVARVTGFPLLATATPPLIVLALFHLLSYASYAMPVFLALAGYRLWLSNNSAPASPSPESVAAAESASLWRPARAAAIGAVIASAVVLWSLSTSSQMTGSVLLIALAANASSFFMPTFLIYTAVVASVLRLKAKPDAIAMAALLAALIPFGFWASSLSSVLMTKARERATVAAIPKTRLPAKVGGVVIEGDDWSLINCARRLVLSADHDIGAVFTHGQGKSPYLRFTRATANSPVNKGVAADGAPSDYVLIRFPRRPEFLRDSRVPPDIASPPQEIYAVDPGGTHLVAATYAAHNPLPAFPPMLTTYGWYHGDNSTTPEKSCKSAGDFIQRELLDKLPAGST
jgi:hypothetical protein